MRRSVIPLIGCISFALCGAVNWSADKDEEVAQEHAVDASHKSASQARSSDKTVVKEIVYGLELDSSQLFVTSQPLEGADRERKRVKLKFELPVKTQLDDWSLEKLGNKNLVAVLKVTRDNSFDFYCLTFIAEAGGHVRDRFAFYEAKIFTSTENLKILALGGKHFFGSVFVVLGNIDQGGDKEITTITKGLFYFSLCPWPPSDGDISPFEATSQPLKSPVE